VFNGYWEQLGIRTSDAYGMPGPSFEVHSLKLAARVGPSGNKNNQIIIALTQQAGIRIITDSTGKKKPIPFVPKKGHIPTREEFIMTGGVTLIFDLDSLSLRYAISKPLIDVKALAKDHRHLINEKKALELYQYYNADSPGESPFTAYFSSGKQNNSNETFSFLHAR